MGSTIKLSADYKNEVDMSVHYFKSALNDRQFVLIYSKELDSFFIPDVSISALFRDRYGEFRKYLKNSVLLPTNMVCDFISQYRDIKINNLVMSSHLDRIISVAESDGKNIKATDVSIFIKNAKSFCEQEGMEETSDHINGSLFIMQGFMDEIRAKNKDMRLKESLETSKMVIDRYDGLVSALIRANVLINIEDMAQYYYDKSENLHSIKRLTAEYQDSFINDIDSLLMDMLWAASINSHNLFSVHGKPNFENIRKCNRIKLYDDNTEFKKVYTDDENTESNDVNMFVLYTTGNVPRLFVKPDFLEAMDKAGLFKLDAFNTAVISIAIRHQAMAARHPDMSGFNQ